MRREVVLIACVVALAGCGGTHQAAPPPTTTAPPPTTKHHKVCRAVIAPLVVTVLDGDLRKRVRGALVRILHEHGRTNGHGQVVLRGPRKRLEVEISRPGYTALRMPVDFRRRRQTIRIYQPKLQWPIYGATPARTQAQTEIKLRPPFRLVWSKSMGHLIEFPAVVWDGWAYIGSQFGTVKAVDMRSGNVAWTHATPGSPRMASSPAVWENEIVYHTMAGGVYVLNRANGKLIWSWNAGAPIEPSPIVVGGIDYFGTSGGSVYALDLKTHKLRWSRSLGAKITSSVAIAGGRLYVGDYAGRLWALSPRTGSAHVLGTVNGKIYGTPAVAQGRVFVPSSDGDSMTAFTTSGRYLWRITTGNYVYSSPAVWRGRVFFGSYDGDFYGVSAATGHVFWRIYTGGPISGAAIAVDGIAYAGSLSHRIVGVDVRTGREVFVFPHGDFVPVSGNGMRLLLNGFDRLYAVEPRHTLRHYRKSHVARHHRHKPPPAC